MVMAMVSSPPAVTSKHQDAALRHATDCTPLTIKDLLSRSNEELATLYSSLGIPMPDSVPSREQLFYAVCSKLFDKNGLDNRTPAAQRVVAQNASGGVHMSVSVHDMKILEAVEYTQRVDDGAHCGQWQEADLILLGVSRSGKTPLAMFLASKGYKVANFPLVQGLEIPQELYDFDQSRVVALVLDPDVLVAIRKKRAAQMGLNERSATYVDIERIEEELQWVKQLYRKHPQWTMLDVTFRGIEETATKILKVMAQRHPDRFSPPDHN